MPFHTASVARQTAHLTSVTDAVPHGVSSPSDRSPDVGAGQARYLAQVVPHQIERHGLVPLAPAGVLRTLEEELGILPVTAGRVARACRNRARPLSTASVTNTELEQRHTTAAQDFIPHT